MRAAVPKVRTVVEPFSSCASQLDEVDMYEYLTVVCGIPSLTHHHLVLNMTSPVLFKFGIIAHDYIFLQYERIRSTFYMKTFYVRI